MMSKKQFIISKNTGERFPTGIIDVERQTHLWVAEVVDLLNEQQARIEMLEKGILDCLFNNKSVGMLAEEMRLVE